jgi:endonuclease/exonuclease/phosphatase (EEP) superfamily protein YafD
LKQVELKSPDIIALIEIDRKWKNALDTLKGYHYSKVLPREDNFGIAIYSKIKLTDVEIKYFSKSRVPSIYSKLDLGDSSISILLTHPMPPGSTEGFINRNSTLASIGSFIKKSNHNAIVIGDLNTAMWSPYYKKLIEKSKLYNSRKGFGVTPTWPSFYFTRIPIDHCLLSPSLKVSEFTVMDSIGSDHLPLALKILYE